jgi:hypothetical protein
MADAGPDIAGCDLNDRLDCCARCAVMDDTRSSRTRGVRLPHCPVEAGVVRPGKLTSQIRPERAPSVPPRRPLLSRASGTLLAGARRFCTLSEGGVTLRALGTLPWHGRSIRLAAPPRRSPRLRSRVLGHSRTRTSWLRELMSSLPKTLCRWGARLPPGCSSATTRGSWPCPAALRPCSPARSPRHGAEPPTSSSRASRSSGAGHYDLEAHCRPGAQRRNGRRLSLRTSRSNHH